MAYQTIYPYTGEVLKTYENHDDAYVEQALATSSALYHSWRQDPVSTRTPVLHKLAQIFTDQEDELAKVLTLDMGKRLVEAKGEVQICAAIAQYYADNAEAFMAPTPIKSSMGDAMTENHPLGVLMAVEPWNFPFYQMMRVFAPNFAAGNPLVFKHASITPGSAVAFEKAVKDAGAPDGSCTNLFIDYDQVSHVIADPRVAGVALTGSERAGKLVAAEAGEHLKKSSLELGGSDAFIVLNDANMDDVNALTRSARLFNSGQVCTSSKRFIVTEKNYDNFLANLKSEFEQVKMGDPLEDDTTLAPLSSASAQKKVEGQIQDAIEGGATVVLGGHPVESKGNFVEATILTDMTPDNPMYYQEIFGPVAEVFKVKDEAEAIAMANDSNFGLGGTVFAGDPDHGAEVASQIETGMVFVNTYSGTLPELPFGGVKNSGYGRELGKIGFETFLNQETIVVNHKAHPDMENRFGGFVS